MSELLARLGLPPESRAVIICLDDLGTFHAANVAIYGALRSGRATSASLMVPAPWARKAAADYRGEDLGVHLTLNSEIDGYRWGPITFAPSLLDGDGAFPRTIEDVWEHADLDEVRREWRAQIERARLWGVDVQHLDAHLGGVELRPEFFDVYLDLAEEFALPVRLPGIEDEHRIGFPFRSLAENRSILAPDRAIRIPPRRASTEMLVEALCAQQPGVIELRLRPAAPSEELRAGTDDWAERALELELLGDSDDATSLVGRLRSENIELTSYRELRNLMVGSARLRAER